MARLLTDDSVELRARFDGCLDTLKVPTVCGYGEIFAENRSRSSQGFGCLKGGFNLYNSWTVWVQGTVATNLAVGRLIVEDGCFVSTNTRLCDFANSACLSSESLAKRYLEALHPILKNYGDAIRLSVVDHGPQGRPEFDDLLVTARIEQKIFALNGRPKGLS